MTIGMSRYTRIGDALRRLEPPSILKDNGLIDNAAVTGNRFQRISKRVRRCHDVIQQSKVSTVRLRNESKAKKIVVELFGDDFQKCDLLSDTDALFGIIDLIDSQSDARQKRLQLDTRSERAIGREPRQYTLRSSVSPRAA